jgi:hypothetical protein
MPSSPNFPGEYRFIATRHEVYQCDKCGRVCALRYWSRHKSLCDGIVDCTRCGGLYPCSDPKCRARMRPPKGRRLPAGPTSAQITFFESLEGPSKPPGYDQETCDTDETPAD